MLNLKTEEFVLDGPLLQSLQQLIQWVGEFVLYLLANLPNQVSALWGAAMLYFWSRTLRALDLGSTFKIKVSPSHLTNVLSLLPDV